MSWHPLFDAAGTEIAVTPLSECEMIASNNRKTVVGGFILNPDLARIKEFTHDEDAIEIDSTVDRVFQIFKTKNEW